MSQDISLSLWSQARAGVLPTRVFLTLETASALGQHLSLTDSGWPGDQELDRLVNA